MVKSPPGSCPCRPGDFRCADHGRYVYLLMRQVLAHTRFIPDAGVGPHNAAKSQGLQAQDFLATPVETAAAGSSAEIGGSITDYFPVEVHYEVLIEQLACPAV